MMNISLAEFREFAEYRESTTSVNASMIAHPDIQSISNKQFY